MTVSRECREGKFPDQWSKQKFLLMKPKSKEKVLILKRPGCFFAYGLAASSSKDRNQVLSNPYLSRDSKSV